MAYTISYTTPAGAFSFTKETAQEALDMAMDYIHEGYRHVKIEDTDKGITYSTHNIRRAWRAARDWKKMPLEALRRRERQHDPGHPPRPTQTGRLTRMLSCLVASAGRSLWREQEVKPHRE